MVCSGLFNRDGRRNTGSYIRPTCSILSSTRGVSYGLLGKTDGRCPGAAAGDKDSKEENMKRIVVLLLTLALLLGLVGCSSAPALAPDDTLEPVVEEPEPVQETTPATFIISDLVISPTEVSKGERIAISVLVTNNSNCAGNYEVVFKMGGVVEEVVDVPLASGDIKKVELALNVYSYDVGTHPVDVNGLLGTFTIKEIQGPIRPIPFENNLYTIRVTGNPLTETETEFSGSYMEITKDGQCTSRSVDGITPREYLVYGMIISCCFQNQNDYGLLRVEILYKGTVVNSSSTIADYGVVIVSN